MTPVIEFLNLILTKLFAAMFWPLKSLAPVWSLLLVSLVTGLFMLWIFAKVSNQDAIRDIKNRIRGQLLGVRLFQHDIRVVLRVQRKILSDTLRYMRYSLTPMLVILVPVLLILVQLNFFFASAPLPVGEDTLIELRMREDVRNSSFSLDCPPEITQTAPPVRATAENAVIWRIRADEPGTHLLTFQVNEESLTKQVIAGEQWSNVPTLRTSSLLDLFLYPGEPAVPGDSAVDVIEIRHPSLPILLFGWNVDWLVLFFILSIVFGFAFKGWVGVEI